MELPTADTTNQTVIQFIYICRHFIIPTNSNLYLTGHTNHMALATASIRPDLLADSEPQSVGFLNGKVKQMLNYQPEDPHRRKYKIALSIHFLLVTLLNFVLDLAFQVSRLFNAAAQNWASIHKRAVGKRPIWLILRKFPTRLKHTWLTSKTWGQ